MKEAAYRKDEAKYLKLIAEAMGKHPMVIEDDGSVWQDVNRYETNGSGKVHVLSMQFSPEHHAEQWQELLFWYRNFMVYETLDTSENSHLTKTQYLEGTESPIALILAILDLIGVADE